MIGRVTAFSRVAGPLLLFAFGSMAGALELRSMGVERIEARMRDSGAYTFVTLDRAQQRRTIFGATQYYYAYSGTYRQIAVEAVEEVSPSFFHLNSEGKNVQARVYIDDTGHPHTHLRGNHLGPVKDLAQLRSFALFFGAIGLGLSLLGWGLGALLPADMRGKDAVE